MPPKQTLRQTLSDDAKRGLLNARIKMAIPDEYNVAGQWKTIDMILDACNDDEILKVIQQYHDNKKADE